MIGALMLVAIPQIAADYPSLRNIMILLPGLVGISLARNPNGLASDLRDAIQDARASLTRKKARAASSATRASPPVIAELVGLRGRVTASEAGALDRELGLSSEDCNGAA
jgi:hypothetical protein